MNREFHIACNEYPWQTFYRRSGQDWHLAQAMGEIAQAGFQGYEPLIRSPEHVQEIAPLLERYGLEMRSLYVNSTLHLQEEVERNIEQILVITQAAIPLGTKIIVTNPSPIRWGGDEGKTDAQLVTQAEALNYLGSALAQQGLILAYHNHDAELRHAAREFHHMMLGTNTEHVALCLDPHWIYRGAGNSQIALFDIVQLYGPRIVEIHLRQSQDETWTEFFGPGDIDYPKLFAQLARMNVHPHLVLEQAIESGTSHTLDPIEAHREGLRYTYSRLLQ
jgi:inosose dehydratase